MKQKKLVCSFILTMKKEEGRHQQVWLKRLAACNQKSIYTIYIYIYIYCGGTKITVSKSHLYACCFQALEIIDDVGDRLTLKYSRMQPPNITENDQDFVER